MHGNMNVKFLWSIWFISTNCTQCVKYDLNHKFVLPLTPHELNLPSNTSWFMTSHALAKSKHSPIACSPLSMVSCRLSIKVWLSVSVDFFSPKPFCYIIIPVFYLYLYCLSSSKYPSCGKAYDYLAVFQWLNVSITHFNHYTISYVKPGIPKRINQHWCCAQRRVCCIDIFVNEQNGTSQLKIIFHIISYMQPQPFHLFFIFVDPCIII
jgi:hypothetical protein